jgi:hypothetical protein
VQQGIKVDVRVTPYQIEDPRRQKISIEEAEFSSFLQENSQPGKFRRRLFFGNEKPSLEKHFQVLETFELNDEFLN